MTHFIGLSKDERRGSGAPSSAEPTPLAVSTKRACCLLSIGQTTLFSLIKNGKLKTTKLGKKRLIHYASLLDLLNNTTQEDAA
jgi:excisionase family DNA binding protein